MHQTFDDKYFCIRLLLNRIELEQPKIMKIKYTEAELSEIIQMALSDHVSFTDIETSFSDLLCWFEISTAAFAKDKK